MLAQLRAVLVRIGLWPSPSSRQRPDPDAGNGGLHGDDLTVRANDLHNLLAIMVRCVDAARRHVEQERWAMADFIEFEQIAERADRIIGRLLSGDQDARAVRQPLDVNLTCAEYQGVLLRALGGTIQLHLQLAATRALVRADRSEIERILLNLALSARHAMPDGGMLTIQTASLTEVPSGLRPPHVRAKGYVRITVIDTGPGMPSGVKARVLDRTPLRKSHGTELGLASVAYTVRMLEGALHIESDGGSGTQITVDLPGLDAEGTASQYS